MVSWNDSWLCRDWMECLKFNLIEQIDWKGDGIRKEMRHRGNVVRYKIRELRKKASCKSFEKSSASWGWLRWRWWWERERESRWFEYEGRIPCLICMHELREILWICRFVIGRLFKWREREREWIDWMKQILSSHRAPYTIGKSSLSHHFPDDLL